MAAKATIGQLIVSLGANTGPFEKGMGRSKKKLTEFQKASKKTAATMKALRGVFTGLAAGFATGLISKGFRSIASELDEIGKLSKNLGIGTDELAGLQFAAQRSGVEIGTLNNNLTKMVDSVSDAAMGTGEGVKALAQLNLNAIQLNRLKPDEAFKRIADALARVPAQADKVRIVRDIFGRGSEGLINLLDEGAGGVQRLITRFKSLNGTIGDTTELEEFNDRLLDISTVFKGIGRKIVIELAPGVTKALEALSEFVEGRRLGGGKSVTGEKTFASNITALLAKPFTPLAQAIAKNTAQRTETQIRADIAAGVATRRGAAKPDEIIDRLRQPFDPYRFARSEPLTAVQVRKAMSELEQIRKGVAEQNRKVGEILPGESVTNVNVQLQGI